MLNFQMKEFAETTEDPHSMDKRLTLAKLNTDSGGAVSTGFAAAVVVTVVVVVVLALVAAAAGDDDDDDDDDDDALLSQHLVPV